MDKEILDFFNTDLQFIHGVGPVLASKFNDVLGGRRVFDFLLHAPSYVRPREILDSVTRAQNVDTITNSAGRVVVLSRTGKIAVVNDEGKELFSVALPYASMLVVNEGDKVEKGQKVAEWDPYSNTIIAEKDGIVSFNDLIENVSYQEEVYAMTGIVSRKVINWKTNTKKALNPSIRLVDDKGNVLSLGGKKIAEYLLPTYSTLNVSNGDKIHAGDILARIPVQTKKTGDITGGLPRV